MEEKILQAEIVRVGPKLKIDETLIRAIEGDGKVEVSLGDRKCEATRMGSLEYAKLTESKIPIGVENVPEELGGGTVVLFEL